MIVLIVTALIGVLVIIVSVLLSKRIEDTTPTPLDHALSDIHQTARHAWLTWHPGKRGAR
jgi:hypothetical protein